MHTVKAPIIRCILIIKYEIYRKILINTKYNEYEY